MQKETSVQFRKILTPTGNCSNCKNQERWLAIATSPDHETNASLQTCNSISCKQYAATKALIGVELLDG